MPADKPKTEGPTGTRPSEKAGMGLPMSVGTAAVQAWMDMGAEAVRFVWDRLQQDIKTQQAMLACGSLEEMRKIQAEFFAAAQEQYAAEASKMLELVGKAAAAGPTGLTAGSTAGSTTGSKTARRYDDVPL